MGQIPGLQIGNAVGDEAGAGETLSIGCGGTVSQIRVRADLENHLAAVLHCHAELLIPGDAVSGGFRKELLGRSISRQLETVIEDRENILVDNKEYKYIQITDNDREDFTGEAVSPILCEGDAIGAVVILSREPKQLLGETEQKLAISAAGFLGKQMEQ